ncbi:hypothetical protein AJ88_40630 [Mesorhizobium amorphae CCBAU 01583]|nr:hypothetical protein AJ88_40630 [Mesorhizobium amorphae CCBAU 01583]
MRLRPKRLPHPLRLHPLRLQALRLNRRLPRWHPRLPNQHRRLPNPHRPRLHPPAAADTLAAPVPLQREAQPIGVKAGGLPFGLELSKAI